MITPEASSPPDSEYLCGYRLRAWLAGQHTAMCVAEGGRVLVLKALPEQCLQGGQLHPSVRERLMRVRELATRQVANFIGVQRDLGGKPYLVWEYVDGEALGEYLADPTRSVRQVLLMLRELMLAVEGLHALGIVHGALHPQNVIVGHTGELKLTHISPLLHHQTEVDYDAVAQLLLQVLSTRDQGQTRLRTGASSTVENGAMMTSYSSPLGEVGRGLVPLIHTVIDVPALSKRIAQKIARRTPMLELAGEISRLVEAREDDVAPPEEHPSVERRFRRKAIYSAAGCAGAAAVIAIAAYLLLSGGVDAPQRPPEAPPQLLQPR